MTNRERNFTLQAVSISPPHSSTRHLNHRTFSPGLQFCEHRAPNKAASQSFSVDPPSTSSSARRSTCPIVSSLRLPCGSSDCRSKDSLAHLVHPSSKMISLLYTVLLFLIVSNAFQLVICRQVSGEHSKYQGEFDYCNDDHSGGQTDFVSQNLKSSFFHLVFDC